MAYSSPAGPSADHRVPYPHAQVSEGQGGLEAWKLSGLVHDGVFPATCGALLTRQGRAGSGAAPRSALDLSISFPLHVLNLVRWGMRVMPDATANLDATGAAILTGDPVCTATLLNSNGRGGHGREYPLGAGSGAPGPEGCEPTRRAASSTSDSSGVCALRLDGVVVRHTMIML